MRCKRQNSYIELDSLAILCIELFRFEEPDWVLVASLRVNLQSLTEY